jgi:hypothetical protein
MQLRLWFVVFLTVACITPISRQKGEFRAQVAGWTYRDAVLSHDGKPLYRVVQTDVDRFSTQYDVQTMAGESIALVDFASSYDGTLECHASFPGLNRHFTVRFPIVPFTDLLSSWVDNGVLTKRGIAIIGLEGYTAQRNVKLVDTAANMARMREAGRRHDCRRCEQDYRACEVAESNARAAPARGVTIARSCEAEFQACAQGGFVYHDGVPCGEAPR